jgi:hypothetical protein
MTKSYDSVLGSSTRAWKYQRMELVLQYCRSSAWPHPISVVAELVVSGVLNALALARHESNWTARSGSLAKMLNDVPRDARDFYRSDEPQWEAFYNSDTCMAAMHQEVFHEAVPALTHREQGSPARAARLHQRAEYMRLCADLAERMTAKWVSKQSEATSVG